LQYEFRVLPVLVIASQQVIPPSFVCARVEVLRAIVFVAALAADARSQLGFRLAIPGSPVVRKVVALLVETSVLVLASHTHSRHFPFALPNLNHTDGISRARFRHSDFVTLFKVGRVAVITRKRFFVLSVSIGISISVRSIRIGIVSILMKSNTFVSVRSVSNRGVGRLN